MLKPQCLDALNRIFKLCDFDKDNVLNDIELNEFQVRKKTRPWGREEWKEDLILTTHISFFGGNDDTLAKMLQCTITTTRIGWGEGCSA